MAALALPAPLSLFAAALGWVLLTLALIDLRHLEVPDALSLPLIPAGLAATWWIEPQAILIHAAAAAAGAGTIWLLGEAFRRLRGRAGIGGGDVRLFAVAGAWVGLAALPGVLFLSGIFGLIAAAFLVRRGWVAWGDRIPFVPALSAALWVVFLVPNWCSHDEPRRHLRPSAPSTAQDDFAAGLLASGHFSPASLDRARRAAAESGIGLPTASSIWASRPKTPSPKRWPAPCRSRWSKPTNGRTEAVGDASTRWMEQARLLPLRLEDDHVVVAAADPTDTAALHAAALLFDLPVQVRVATQSDIRKAVAKLHDGSASDAHVTTSAADDDLQRLKDLASEAPVVRFVNRMIIQAVENRASDIHLESHEAGPLLWLRIDGDLSPIEPPATALHRAVVSRIKILAGLDIAERRLPQDGRIQMTVGGRQIDLRVATVPTLHGESVVLRVLDRGSVELDSASWASPAPCSTSGSKPPTVRTASSWSPARPAAARRPLSTVPSCASTIRHANISRSRTRSNTSWPASTRPR